MKSIETRLIEVNRTNAKNAIQAVRAARRHSPELSRIAESYRASQTLLRSLTAEARTKGIDVDAVLCSEYVA